MNTNLIPEIKLREVQELINGYANHGWHITTIFRWRVGPPYMVKIDGKNLPTIRAQGYTLVDALLEAKKAAELFTDKLSRQEGCSRTDRPCEHCPAEDSPTKRKAGDPIGEVQG